MAEYDNKVALGSSITQLVTLIKNALTGKQNTLTAGSGIDITNDVISSTGGGSSLPTDPSTDGSYKLVNTVETESGEQSATLSWEEDSGYTAGSGIAIDNGEISTANDNNQSIYIENNKNIVGRFDGSSYLQLLGINTGGSSITSYSALSILTSLKKGNTQNYGKPTFSASELKQIDSSLTGLLKVNEDGTTNFITLTVAMSNPTDWTTWTEARWIYLNRNPNGRYIVWAKNFAALSNWLGRRIGVSSTNLTATDAYTAIDELATTRIADSLSSTADTPTTNNTIIWQYE